MYTAQPNIDHLRALAEANPNAFETEAKRLIEDFIHSHEGLLQKSLRTFQKHFEERKTSFRDDDWHELLDAWKKKTPAEITYSIKVHIRRAPKKLRYVLFVYQKNLFYKLNVFSFESWKNLCSQNPKEAEKIRLRIIEEHISYTSFDEEHEKKIRMFQWKVDAQRRKSKTPLGSFLFLRNMFFDLVYCERGFLDQLKQFQRPQDNLKMVLDETQKQERRAHLKLVVSEKKT
jgi:hypothetical protein